MKLSRRGFVTLGTGSAAALLTGGAHASSADPPVVAGTLVRVDSPRSAIVDPVEGSRLTVTLAPDAYVSRGHFGALPDLSSFVPGDKVAIDGQSEGPALTATRFQSLYFPASGSITGLDGTVANTTAGKLFVPSDEDRAHYPILAAIPPVHVGDSFEAEIWHDPGRAHPVVVSLRVM